MTLPMLIVSVLKVLTYIINSITGHPIGLAEILAIMSVSTFITAIILYYLYCMLVIVSLFFTGYDKQTNLYGYDDARSTVTET